MPSETSRRRAKPTRVQRRRVKGWRLPPNTVIVDRTTKWGNPHVMDRGGPDGMSPREYAVLNFRRMLAGYIMLGKRPTVEQQEAYLEYAKANIKTLRGKNLACWCALSQPCHADVLLEAANGRRRS